MHVMNSWDKKLHCIAALVLLAARGIDPPSTAVHIHRRLQGRAHHTPFMNATNSFRSAKSRPICSALAKPV